MIKKDYYSCYHYMYHNEYKFQCYNTIFYLIKYTVKKCDRYNYINPQDLYKPISNEPSKCTQNPIPILENYQDFISKDLIVQSDLITKSYNLNKLSRDKISKELQKDAKDAKDAYAIIEYNEKILEIPERKCKKKMIGIVVIKRCKTYNTNYLEISYKLINLK